jgi:hypothetical protein
MDRREPASNARVHSLVRSLFLFFAHLGPFGLLLLGVLDSSFLFMPLGNDLLLVALTARRHGMLPLYVIMAATGSAIGCWLLDLLMRRKGEEGLKRMMPPKRVEYLKRKIGERAGLALAVASLAPPPFPFTPVVAAASAFQYPRARLLTVIAAMRVVRFAIIGALAIKFGRHILRIAQEPAFHWAVLIFLAICLIGSAISIRGWVVRSRNA